jgi:DsbC/DsbD-like thiol-disulfide interchange protein
MTMNRRSFLSTLCAMSFWNDAHAEAAPWKARFLDGGFDGKDYWAGLLVEMSKNWKTYWRVPGAGGIPPQVEATGVNLKSAELLFPVPQRFYDESGESIGYKDQVVFPLRLAPRDIAAPLEVKFLSFFGVCEVVCIPARSEATLYFAMGSNQSPDAMLVNAWREKLPVLSENGPVLSAAVTMKNNKPALDILFNGKTDDLFISGSDKYYFHAPRIEDQRASVAVSGAKSPDELKGQALQIVTVAGGKGLEQTVLVG